MSDFETLTIGPVVNEVSSVYAQGVGAWTNFIIDKFSSDVALMYLVRMAAFYKKVREANVSEPLPRSVKDILVKEL